MFANSNISMLVLLCAVTACCASVLYPPKNSTAFENTCEPNRRKEFHIAAAKMNWYQADQFCHFNGMHLASITSEEEQNAVIQLASETGFLEFDLWTSGNDLGVYDSFVWMSTGCPFKYTKWANGEPFPNIGHRCIYMYGNAQKTWDNYYCSYETYAVCEKFLD